jgi:hypothetical protein
VPLFKPNNAKTVLEIVPLYGINVLANIPVLHLYCDSPPIWTEWRRELEQYVCAAIANATFEVDSGFRKIVFESGVRNRLHPEVSIRLPWTVRSAIRLTAPATSFCVMSKVTCDKHAAFPDVRRYD